MPYDPAKDLCGDDYDPTRDRGCPVAGQPSCGNPITPATGNKYQREVDYSGTGPFAPSFTRHYNSSYIRTHELGGGWQHNYDLRLSLIADAGGNLVTVNSARPDGKEAIYNKSGSNWTSYTDTPDSLGEVRDGNGTLTGWRYSRGEGDVVENYDASGKLLSIVNREGLTQTLSYSQGAGATAPGPGLLVSVTGPFGRALQFTYDSLFRLSTMTDPAGGTYSYGYDASNRLTGVTYPDGKIRSYQYNEPANNGGIDLPYHLTGVTDENGSRFATFKYSGTVVGNTVQARAVSTEHAGGVDGVTLSYGPTTTVAADALGGTRTYGFTVQQATPKNDNISGDACPSCGPASTTYDTNGYIASSTDWNGNRANSVHDARGLETSRTEGLTSAGSTTPQTRTISTQWHASFRLPVKVAEPLRITSYVYNGDGAASCGVKADGTTLVPGVLCAKTIQASSDVTGAGGLGATLVGTPRTWTYTYNDNGSVLTMNGPRTDVSDVTTYTYDASDDPDLGKRGNVATIANALGQQSSITAYNAHGQPLTVVDPNSLTTTLTYDARKRLTSRNVGGELTSYTYDGVGQLTQVTLPDGSSLTYSYDAAHRLTSMADNLGNRIAYTLDAMGNRMQEQVFDPANALAQTRSRVFNSLNRLAQELGAQNQTTTYGYDNQGNLTSIDGPLSGAVDVTINAYDALNRLIRVTDPNQGQTQYAYNGIDQLVSVTDPRNLATIYNYDGLANLNSQQSPDTGTTANIYDAAGNLLTQTDAKGQITSYAYDALNRVTSITFSGGSKQTYAYDLGANGIGRLSSITETNPAQQVTSILAYAYDQHGRTTSETRTINGVAYMLAYSYDSSGRLNGLAYPSGRTVAYGFDALGRVNQVSTTPVGGAQQVVASNVAYQPFGGVKSYTLGNGRTYTRGYDLDGRIASYNLGTQNFAIGYDAASRISFISDTANAANSNTYSYDNLDRLVSAVLPNLPFAYGCDAVGNRTSKTVGSATDTYAYGATSNRLASITAQAGAVRSFTFDADGSTTNDGINQYIYDTRGRLTQSVGALGTTTYQVNALGQRIRKTNSTEDRVYLYDTRGRLIAETDPGGGLKREYLYLNDIPLVVFQ